MLYGRGKNIKEIYNLGLSLLKQCREKTPGIFTDFELKAARYSDDIDLDFEAEDDCSNDGICEILSYTLDGEKNIARTALIEKYNYSASA